MFALLLRCLLCICLILNGSGYAMASAHLQMGPTASTAVMLEAAPDDIPPCHRNADTSGLAGVGLPEAAQDALFAAAKHPVSDCCQSGACQCACMHQAHAAIPMHAWCHDMTGHSDDVGLLPPGLPAPTLPLLIRPPIG